MKQMITARQIGGPDVYGELVSCELIGHHRQFIRNDEFTDELGHVEPCEIWNNTLIYAGVLQRHLNIDGSKTDRVIVWNVWITTDFGGDDANNYIQHVPQNYWVYVANNRFAVSELAAKIKEPFGEHDWILRYMHPMTQIDGHKFLIESEDVFVQLEKGSCHITVQIKDALTGTAIAMRFISYLQEYITGKYKGPDILD